MHIVSASDDHTIRIWNTATGKCEVELKGHRSWVNSAIFSANGTVYILCQHLMIILHESGIQSQESVRKS